MNNEERGSWYLFTGLVLGAILGLVYAWLIQPVEYVDTPPASLRQDFKDRYRAMIAAAFIANHDLVRAQARMELLQDEDPFRVLSEQAQRTLAENGSPEEARALGLLAVALNQASPGLSTKTLANQSTATIRVHITGVFLASPTNTTTEAVSTITSYTSTTRPSTPSSSFEPLGTISEIKTPTNALSNDQKTPAGATQSKPSDTPNTWRTSTTNPEGPFILMGREEICGQRLSAPLIQVEALDHFGLPVPGVLVIVTWKDGEERFYTGLKSEKSLGYADFTPTPGIAYTLRLGEGGETVVGLTALACKDSGGESYWGTWLLRFTQP